MPFNDKTGFTRESRAARPIGPHVNRPPTQPHQLGRDAHDNHKEVLQKQRRTRSRSRTPVKEVRALRRGEQGKSVAQIEKFHQAGFVMSGSRSSRMNAVREMKEAESEENKKKELLKRVDDRSKNEDKIVDHFRQVLVDKRRGDATKDTKPQSGRK